MSEMVVPITSAASSPMGLSAEDMIDFYKVMPCPRTCNHDWSTCFYAHPNEKARRRSLAVHWYSAIFCVDMLHKSSCKQGDSCNLAHSVFEYWMHPDKYRTKYCRDGMNCKRTICFFAHGPHELRHPGEYTPRAPGSCDSTNLTPSTLTPAFYSSSTGAGSLDTAIISPNNMAAGVGTAPAKAAAVGAAAGSMGAACFGPAKAYLSSEVDRYANNSNSVLAIMTPAASAAAAGTLRHQLQSELVFVQQQQPQVASGMAVVTGPQRLQLQDATGSEATAQVARLKLDYDKKVAEAELAAAKAAEARSLLQQLASALTVSSDSASTLLASSPGTTSSTIMSSPSALSGGNATPLAVPGQGVTGQTVLSPAHLDPSQLLQQLQFQSNSTTASLPATTGTAAVLGVLNAPCGSSQLLQLPAIQRSPVAGSAGQNVVYLNPQHVLTLNGNSYQWN